MSRAAFSAFARNAGKFQYMRSGAMKGMNTMFMKAKPNVNQMNILFPEFMTKTQRINQLAKLACRSRRLCTLQMQKVHLGALSVLLTLTGEILVDFQEMLSSLEEEEDDELLRRTSLLQTSRVQFI